MTLRLIYDDSDKAHSIKVIEKNERELIIYFISLAFIKTSKLFYDYSNYQFLLMP